MGLWAAASRSRCSGFGGTGPQPGPPRRPAKRRAALPSNRHPGHGHHPRVAWPELVRAPLSALAPAEDAATSPASKPPRARRSILAGARGSCRTPCLEPVSFRGPRGEPRRPAQGRPSFLESNHGAEALFRRRLRRPRRAGRNLAVPVKRPRKINAPHTRQWAAHAFAIEMGRLPSAPSASCFWAAGGCLPRQSACRWTTTTTNRHSRFHKHPPCSTAAARLRAGAKPGALIAEGWCGLKPPEGHARPSGDTLGRVSSGQGKGRPGILEPRRDAAAAWPKGAPERSRETRYRLAATSEVTRKAPNGPNPGFNHARAAGGRFAVGPSGGPSIARPSWFPGARWSGRGRMEIEVASRR